MFLQRFFGIRDFESLRRETRAKRTLFDAVTPVICERLEPRQLLTAYFYEVPSQ